MTKKSSNYFVGLGSRSEAFDVKTLGNAIVLAGDGNDYIRGSDILYDKDGYVVGDGTDWLAGGQGSDIIEAGHGNDVIYGDDWGDPLGPGSADHILGGGGNDTIWGGGGNDFINGENGDDTIDGGAGDDVIFGGPGTDILKGGEGHDVIYSISPAMWAAAMLQIVTGYNGLNDQATAASTHIGSLGYVGGDYKPDTLMGDGGNDHLHSGYGMDTLTGGTGKDTFYFEYQPGSTSDIITDFSVKDDTIALAKAYFVGAGPKGVLAAAKFHVGTKAHDASDRFVYNPNNGKLIFDMDGKGGDPGLLIATLGLNLKMTAADILII